MINQHFTVKNYILFLQGNGLFIFLIITNNKFMLTNLFFTNLHMYIYHIFLGKTLATFYHVFHYVSSFIIKFKHMVVLANEPHNFVFSKTTKFNAVMYLQLIRSLGQLM